MTKKERQRIAKTCLLIAYGALLLAATSTALANLWVVFGASDYSAFIFPVLGFVVAVVACIVAVVIAHVDKFLNEESEEPSKTQ